MHYNVAQLLKEPIGSTRNYKIDETFLTEGASSELFPDGQVSLMRTDEGILVEARIPVRLWLTCSRCLEGFHYPMQCVIEEEYLPTLDVNTGQASLMPETSEGSFTIQQKHVLDLTEALRQYSITNQPMKPVCRQNCLGLCPDCGTNRNENACSCPEMDMDPRWGPLVGLQRR